MFWPHWVFAVAGRLALVAVSGASLCSALSCGVWPLGRSGFSSHGTQAGFPHGMWGWTGVPCIARQTPNHWATREDLLISIILSFVFFPDTFPYGISFLLIVHFTFPHPLQQQDLDALSANCALNWPFLATPVTFLPLQASHLCIFPKPQKRAGGDKGCWYYVAESEVKVKVAKSCPTLCDPDDYTIHGILQARMLEWVGAPFSRGSSQSRDWTQISHIAGGFFTGWATREAQQYWSG